MKLVQATFEKLCSLAVMEILKTAIGTYRSELNSVYIKLNIPNGYA